MSCVRPPCPESPWAASPGQQRKFLTSEQIDVNTLFQGHFVSEVRVSKGRKKYTAGCLLCQKPFSSHIWSTLSDINLCQNDKTGIDGSKRPSLVGRDGIQTTLFLPSTWVVPEFPVSQFEVDPLPLLDPPHTIDCIPTGGTLFLIHHTNCFVDLSKMNRFIRGQTLCVS